MMRIAMKLVLAAFFGIGFVSVSRADILVFNAFLDGPSESPPNASPGTGEATVTIDTTAITMRVEAAFRDLLGTTTASHIHAPTAAPNSGNAGVATQTPTFTGFPLGVSSGTYDHTFDMTQASSYNAPFITANGGTPISAFNALVGFMQEERSYLNIHSNLFPGGEIRGFLHLVPEPATLAMLGIGSLALVRRRLRKRVEST